MILGITQVRKSITGPNFFMDLSSISIDFFGPYCHKEIHIEISCQRKIRLYTSYEHEPWIIVPDGYNAKWDASFHWDSMEIVPPKDAIMIKPCKYT